MQGEGIPVVSALPAPEKKKQKNVEHLVVRCKTGVWDYKLTE